MSNTLTPEQLARLKAQSGASEGGTRLPVLNRIALGGSAVPVKDPANPGSFIRPPVEYFKSIYIGKEDDAKPEKVSIGEKVEVIIVKSRRKLVERNKEKIVMQTTEHTSAKSVVSLWKDGKVIDTGVAEDLRAKYPALRMVGNLYCLIPSTGELVMVTVKGSAFGTKIRDKKYPAFFDYLSKLSKAGGTFAYVTELGGVLEEGETDYYAMTFTQGRPTTPEEQLAVLEKQDELVAIMDEYDANNAVAKVGDGNKQNDDDAVLDAQLEALNDTKPIAAEIQDHDEAW